MNKIKNNKWVSIIVQFLILISPIVIFGYISMVLFDNLDGSYKDRYLLASLLFVTLTGGSYLVLFLNENINKNAYYDFLLRRKTIYSDHGNFFMMKSNTTLGDRYYLYDNKYYFSLYKISSDSFTLPFNEVDEVNMERIIVKYREEIDIEYNKKLKVKESDRKFNEWSGVLGQRLKRDKEIDKLV